MAQLFYGKTLGDLFNFSNNFSAVVSISPADFFISAQASTDLVAANAAFGSAYTATLDPSTRTKVSIQVRNAAALTLVNMLRFLVSSIGNNPQITDVQRTELNIPIRKRPVRRPAPTISPDIDIVERGGTMVRIRLHSASLTPRRAKPDGVAGAAIFTFVGATPPQILTEWVAWGVTGKTMNDIEFDPALPAGTKVWFTAFYYNSAGSGPGAEPVSTVLAGGSTMRLAA